MDDTRRLAAIVLAAGSGARFGGAKQFARVGADRLVDLALACVAPVVGSVVVVVPPGTTWDGDGIGVAGGATRAESVRNGLARVPDETEIVVVHDAAHPLASRATTEAVVAAVRDGADGAVPILEMREAIAYTHGGRLGAGVPRAALVFVQMPHAFRAPLLRAAHASGRVASDDATLFQELGHRVMTVPGDPRNLHVTTPADFDLLREIVGNGRRLP